MRGNLKIQYLLPIVIIIWGIIGFQINKALNNNSVAVKNSDKIFIKPLKKKKVKTFSVDFFDRDPFLGKTNRTHNNGKIVAKPTPSISKKENRSIIYKGSLMNKGSKESIFVVEIDKKQYLLKKNQSVNNLKIISGNSKEISLLSNRKLIKVTKK